MGKILLVSDLHFANRVAFGKQPTNPKYKGCNSRFHIIADAFNAAVDMAVKEGCEAVVVPGDIYHERMILQVPVLNAVYSLLEEASKRIRTIVMAGNHDMVSAKALYGESGLHSLYAFQKVCEVVDNPTNIELDNFSLSLIPFNISREKTINDAKKLFYDVQRTRPCPSVAFFHHSFDGAITGPTNWRMPSEISVGDLPPFDLLFSGHLHNHQAVGVSKKLNYVGSLVQHDLGERTYKPGWIILDSDGTWKHVENTVSPRFVVVDAATEKDLDGLNEQDFKVIKWLGDEEVGIKLRENIDNAIVEIKPLVTKTQSRTTITTNDTVEEMLRKYVKAKLGVVNKAYLGEGINIYKGSE